jgi:ABC-type transport system involved in cytochrome c biogenesis ATPase subunit
MCSFPKKRGSASSGEPFFEEAKGNVAMRVKSINVTSLFGVFNHEILINTTERVTIIHGPNGFGKTVMLRMIAAVAEGTTSIFQQTPIR